MGASWILFASESQCRQGLRSADVCRDADFFPAFRIGCARGGCRPSGWLSWSTTCANLDCAKVYPQKVHFSTPARVRGHFDLPACAEASSPGQIHSQRKQFCPEEKRSNALGSPDNSARAGQDPISLIYYYPPQMEQSPPEVTPEQKTLWLLTGLSSEWS
jgi:hypothetical protein